MKTLIKYLTLLSIGGILYMIMEILFSGSTHWTMGILGSICFVLIGLINNYYTLPLYKQMLIGAVIITALEFISGVILNIGFNLNIWDYSNLPFNICGQICLPFTLIWFFLCLPAILLDDWIRYAFFGEERKVYKLH